MADASLGLRATLQPVFGPGDAAEGSQLALNPFQRGVRSGLSGALGSAQEFAGTGIDALGGSGQSFHDAAVQNAQEAATYAPKLDRWADVHDLGDTAEYTMGQFGKMLPLVGPSMVGGGLASAARLGAGARMAAGMAPLHPVMAGGVVERLNADPATAGLSPQEKMRVANAEGLAAAALYAAPGHLMQGRALGLPGLPGYAAKGTLNPLRTAGNVVGETALQSAGMGAAGMAAGQLGRTVQRSYNPAYQQGEDADLLKEEFAGGMAGMAPLALPHAVAAHTFGAAVKPTLDAAKKVPGATVDAATAGAAGARELFKDAMPTSFEDAALKAGSLASKVTGFAAGTKNKALDTLDHVLNKTRDPDVDALIKPQTGMDDATLRADDVAKHAAAQKLAAEVEAQINDVPPDVALAAKRYMAGPKTLDSWQEFSDTLRQWKRDGAVKDAVDRFSDELGKVVKAAGEGYAKKNAQRPRDEFDDLLTQHLAAHTGSEAEAPRASSAMRQWVESWKPDREPLVPHSLRDLVDDPVAATTMTYELMKRQGLVDNDAALQHVVSELQSRSEASKHEAAVVEDNLLPTAQMKHQFSGEDHARIAEAVKQQIETGKLNEKALDALFGPNKERVLEALRRQMPEKTQSATVDDLGGQSDATKPNEVTPETTWHHYKENTPYDKLGKIENIDKETGEITEVGTHEGHAARKAREMMAGEHAAVRKQGYLDYLHELHGKDTDAVLRDSLDFVQRTRDKTGPLTDKELNDRFYVLRAEQRSDKSTGLDIPASEFKTVTGTRNNKWGVSPGKDNEFATASNGRIWLERADGTKFVTSTKKIIARMRQAKKAGEFVGEDRGLPEQRSMLLAGISSLLNVRDGEGKPVIKSAGYLDEPGKNSNQRIKWLDKGTDLPDHLSMYDGTLKDARTESERQRVQDMHDTLKEAGQTELLKSGDATKIETAYKKLQAEREMSAPVQRIVETKGKHQVIATDAEPRVSRSKDRETGNEVTEYNEMKGGVRDTTEIEGKKEEPRKYDESTQEELHPRPTKNDAVVTPAKPDEKQLGFLMDTLRKGMPAFNAMLKAAKPEQRAAMRDVLRSMVEAKSADAPFWQGKGPKDYEAFAKRARLALSALSDETLAPGASNVGPGTKPVDGRKLNAQSVVMRGKAEDLPIALTKRIIPSNFNAPLENKRAPMLGEILEHIANNAKSDWSRQVARRLLSTPIKDIPVYGDSLPSGADGHTLGQYVRRPTGRGDIHRHVNLDIARGLTNTTVLHEAAHAYIIESLDSPTLAQAPFVNSLQNAYRVAKAAHQSVGRNSDFNYGFKDIGEFVSELLGDHSFKEYLDSLPLTASALKLIVKDGRTAGVVSDAFSQKGLFAGIAKAVSGIVSTIKSGEPASSTLSAAVDHLVSEIVDTPVRNGGEFRYNRQEPTLDSERRATPEELKAANDYLDKTLGPQMRREFLETIGGHSADWTPEAQGNVIRVATNAVGGVYTNAVHESMHEFWGRLRASKQGDVEKLLHQVTSAAPVVRSLERILKDYPEAAANVRKDPSEALAYAYQFWEAGHPDLRLGPQTTSFFEKVAKFFRKVTGLLRDDEKVEAIFREFKEGKLQDASIAGKVLDKLNNSERRVAAVAKTMEPFRKAVTDWVGSAEDNLLKHADENVRWVGKEFSDHNDGFLAAADRSEKQWMSKLKNVFAKHEADDVRAAVDDLQKGKLSPDAKIAAVQNDVRAFLDEMHPYLKDAGVSVMDHETGRWTGIQKIKDYFPRSWDVEKLSSDGEQFVKLLLDNHSKELTAIAKQANEEVAKGGTPDKGLASSKIKGREITAEDIAAAIHNRLTLSHGQEELAEDGYSLGYSPMMKAVNRRSLNWLDMTKFHEFQNKDLVNIMSTYVMQGSKRAEYTRRFGPDGSQIQDRIKLATEGELARVVEDKYGVKDAAKKARGMISAMKSLAKAGAEEPSFEAALARVINDNLDPAKHIAETDVAALLDQAAERLNPQRRAVMAMEGTLGHDISPTLRKGMGWVLAYQNWRMLPMALFSNLIDPLGIMVRGGEMNDVFSAYKNALSDVVNSWRGKDRDDNLTQMAEAIGVLDAHGYMSSMGSMMNSIYMSGKAKDLNDALFKLNGMEALNRSMRMTATQAAIGFIKRHATTPNDHSTRLLDEVGLTADYVKQHLDEKTGLNVQDPAIQRAVAQWVNEAILRPNSALRPSRMSDPHWALFSHFKGFMYAMKKQILDRAAREARYGNYTAASTLALGYVPVMYAADLAKLITQNAIAGNAKLPAWWEGMDAKDHAEYAAERAGLLGPGQMARDAFEYGPSAIAGPTAEQMTSVFTEPLGKTVTAAMPWSQFFASAQRAVND